MMESESPDPSIPGEMVALSALLYRTDTWTPLPDKFVHIEASDFGGSSWWHAGYYWTDSNGRAVGGTRFLFPHEDQQLRATFEGDSEFAPSVSSLEPHATRIPIIQGAVGTSSGPLVQPILPDGFLPAIVAFVAPPIALHLFRRRRERRSWARR
jgi:hypothetical protein